MMYIFGGIMMLFGSIILGSVVSKKDKPLGAVGLAIALAGGILFGYYIR